MINNQPIAEMIRQARTSRKITQKKLAKLTHLSAISISKMETNQNHPGLNNLIKIANALNYQPIMIFVNQYTKKYDYILNQSTNVIDFNSNLAYIIQTIRHKKYLNKNQFAKYINITLPTLYKIENSTGNTTWNTLNHIAQVTHYQLQLLLINYSEINQYPGLCQSKPNPKKEVI